MRANATTRIKGSDENVRVNNFELVSMKTRFAFWALTALALGGCGGGGGSEDTQREGVFVDSPVQGVRYVTASGSGTTNASGVFVYLAGEIVAFYVGDILLGQTSDKAEVTPIDLVAGQLPDRPRFPN